MTKTQTFVPKKPYKRPAHWQDIARFAKSDTDKFKLATIRNYPNDFSNDSVDSANNLRRIKVYMSDFDKQTLQPKESSKPPAYGTEIDQELLNYVQLELREGRGVNLRLLKEKLTEILKRNGIFETLTEQGTDLNSTPCVFEKSWATRFCIRHGLNTLIAGRVAYFESVPQSQDVHALLQLHQE